MLRTTPSLLLSALALFSLVALGCDGAASGSSDCRNAGQECAEGWTCQANDAGAYECLSATGGSFQTGDPNNPSGGADPSGDGGEGANDGPPATDCLYPFGASDLGEDFGIACTSDNECLHGTCLMPADEGNVTNNVFGFCTRGCDCDDASDAKLSSEDDTYHCVYPGGCFIGESQGAWRHAVLKCSSIDDCQAVDPRYTHCATTDSMTVVEDTCGSLRKVCQAHQ